MKSVLLSDERGRDGTSQGHVILIRKQKRCFASRFLFLLSRPFAGPGQGWLLTFLQLFEFLVQIVVARHQSVVPVRTKRLAGNMNSNRN